jgi:hypothetical protein
MNRCFGRVSVIPVLGANGRKSKCHTVSSPASCSITSYTGSWKVLSISFASFVAHSSNRPSTLVLLMCSSIFHRAALFFLASSSDRAGGFTVGMPLSFLWACCTAVLYCSRRSVHIVQAVRRESTQLCRSRSWRLGFLLGIHSVLKYVAEQKSHTAIVGDLAVTVYGLKIGDRLRVNSSTQYCCPLQHDTVVVSEFARVSGALSTAFVSTSIRASLVRRVSPVVSSAARLTSCSANLQHSLWLGYLSNKDNQPQYAIMPYAK